MAMHLPKLLTLQQAAEVLNATLCPRGGTCANRHNPRCLFRKALREVEG